MVDIRYDRSVLLARSGLWLDPQRTKPRAFVSHAHSDHTGRHGEIFCTPATFALMRARMGGKWKVVRELNYGEKWQTLDWGLTLIPAGHVLGSAQVFFESSEGTLLYTGDFKLRSGFTSEQAQSRRAETLIMETTFARPRYQFPDPETIFAEIADFCWSAYRNGDIPVLLAYSLGKAQEVLAGLSGIGLPILLHEAVERITHVYAEFGVRFPKFSGYKSGDIGGHILIWPPNARDSLERLGYRNLRFAAVTGWALDSSAIYQLGVEKAFPLSDHADYHDLLRYVEEVNPRRVLTLHGYAAEFARDLRARGREAWALGVPNQLELPL